MTACIYYYGSIKIYLTNLLCCFFILNTFTRFNHAMAFLPRALWMSCSVKCKSYRALGMVRQRTLRMVVSWNLVGYSVLGRTGCVLCVQVLSAELSRPLHCYHVESYTAQGASVEAELLQHGEAWSPTLTWCSPALQHSLAEAKVSPLELQICTVPPQIQLCFRRRPLRDSVSSWGDWEKEGNRRNGSIYHCFFFCYLLA